MHRWLVRAIVVFVFVLVALVAAVMVRVAAVSLPIDMDYEVGTLLQVAVMIAVAVGLAFIAARATGRSLARRYGISDSLWPSRRIRIVLVAAYLITWAFGIPAVQSSLDAAAVSAFKRVNEGRPINLESAHPWFESFVSFPLLPGVVATYHESQIAMLSGWGGWRVHVWYGLGVREVCAWRFWVS